MSVVKEVKDTARKTTNKITDTIENIIESNNNNWNDNIRIKNHILKKKNRKRK